MKAKLIKDDNLYGLKDGDKIIGTSDDELNSLLNYPFKLSPKNCEAIKRGYPFDEYEEAIAYAGEYGHPSPEGFSDEQIGRLHGFIDGFQKAIELMGDKKYSEMQMTTIYEKGYSAGRNELNSRESDKIKYDYIQSLQQTEWDVDMCTYVDTQGYDIPDADSFNHGNIFTDTCVPKLDADGCLILKLKSE